MDPALYRDAMSRYAGHVQLVTTVLGTPQFTNDFDTESAYYYISTRVTQNAFGMQQIDSRTVLAIYFDKNKKVKDRAVYGLKDGRTIGTFGLVGGLEFGPNSFFWRDNGLMRRAFAADVLSFRALAHIA